MEFSQVISAYFCSTNRKIVIRHSICTYHNTMKHIERQLKYTLIEWMFIKGPELFITIYGK